MLTICYGELENEIYNPKGYFDHSYDPEWIVDPLVKEMILGIDKSEVLYPYVINSPVLGPIPPLMLSGGVKTLILVYKNEGNEIFNITACGDNCAKWLLEIGRRKDVLVDMHHIMDFPDEEFEIKIYNNGKVVHNLREYYETILGLELIKGRILCGE